MTGYRRASRLVVPRAELPRGQRLLLRVLHTVSWGWQLRRADHRKNAPAAKSVHAIPSVMMATDLRAPFTDPALRN